MVKGTSNGTVTDLDGKFSLSAEMGNMLQISYVGYISQEVKVESDKLLRIIMEEDTKKLEEVVVIGYGTQKKVNLTGAVAAVSAEDLASKPVMSTAQALAGLAPGLSVLQTSGRPGQGATVKIRGTGTFSKAGTDPLVLIDGLSGNIDDVDPNDIQSISFLKDAASASIYGNRAANGVILIETKKGAQGKTTITYSNSLVGNSLRNCLIFYHHGNMRNIIIWLCGIWVSRKLIYLNRFKSIEMDLIRIIIQM